MMTMSDFSGRGTLRVAARVCDVEFSLTLTRYNRLDLQTGTLVAEDIGHVTRSDETGELFLEDGRRLSIRVWQVKRNLAAFDVTAVH